MQKLTNMFTPEQFADLWCRREPLETEGLPPQISEKSDWLPFANKLLERMNSGESPISKDEFSLIMVTSEFLDYLVRKNTEL